MRLSDIPVELFSNISAHLPLYSSSSCLLALAMTSHQFRDISIPLLYSHVVVRNERSALAVLKELAQREGKGNCVRGLHIASTLSQKTLDDPNAIDVLTALEKLILSGGLPRLQTLEVHLYGTSWYIHDDPEKREWQRPLEGYAEFRKSCWTDLEQFCPHLRSLTLSEIGNTEDNHLTNSGLFDIQNLTHLSLQFRSGSLDRLGNKKLQECVANMAPHLRSLCLYADSQDGEERLFIDEYLDLSFPVLDSLKLVWWELEDSAKAMEFWDRHPTLEQIEIDPLVGTLWWFIDCSAMDTSAFLPRLRNLKARFQEIRNLAPILERLSKLEVIGSNNAQVPYLLRSVIPSGLPNLRSLLIEQTTNFYNVEFSEIEGAHWYEATNGVFKEADKTGRCRWRKPMWNGYLHSISRGAPNVEELALSGLEMRPKNHPRIISDIASFQRLKRLFVQYIPKALDALDKKEKEQFIALARDTAEACPSLEIFGNFGSPRVLVVL